MQKTRKDLKWLKTKKEFKYLNPQMVTLDTFKNPGVSEVSLVSTEFTSLCPITGQPDYATIKIIYQPKDKCLESKSLKLYLGQYRQYGGFAEEITRKIYIDIKFVLDPEVLTIQGEFKSRGGVTIETFCRE